MLQLTAAAAYVRNNLGSLAVVGAGISLYAAFNPLRLEHLAILAALVVMAVASKTSRDLAATLLPLGIFVWAYDLLRLAADRALAVVDVAGVYALEQALFGWMSAGVDSIGPVDWFRDHHFWAIDLVGGLWYASHIAVPVGFALLMWWYRRAGKLERDGRLREYLWGFMLLNLAGFAVMAVYPVAPPWYVFTHGFAAPAGPIPGDPAGLARVDALLGIEYFTGIYGKATYVFGAMPSMHIACPSWFALNVRHRHARIAAWSYAAVMAFFAVYLTHHYIVDVLAGFGLAVGVWALVRTPPARRLIGALDARTRRLLGQRGSFS